MKLSRSLLILLGSLSITIFIAWFVVFLPPARFQKLFDQLITSANTFASENYPQNLDIEVKNGKVSYNQKDPFCLVIDKKSQSGVVFDNTITNPSINFADTYKNLCKAYVLVGENYVMYPDKNNSYKIQTIDTSINLSLTQNSIKDFITKTSPTLRSFGQSAYTAAPFALLLFFYLFFLSNCLWYAFITQITGKFFNNNLTFGSAYSTSLFVYTILIFINTVIIGYLLNTVLKANFNLNLPLFNTVVIALVSNKLLQKTQPPAVTSTPVPTLPDNDPSLPPSSK